MAYRHLATRPVLAWAAVATLARIPIAMATLAMVFLCRDLPGGYVLGGTLAAVYVVGEVAGSAVLGTLLRPSTMRMQLAIGLAVGALAFGAAAARPATPVLIALSFVAGAAPAANPGGMRAMLAAAVPEKDVPSAFSADAIVTEVIWMAAPALVVLLSLQVSAQAPVLIAAVCMGLAVPGMMLLRIGEAPEPEGGQSVIKAGRSRLLFSGWPIYLTSAAAMSLMAVSELVLPALLEHRHLPLGYAGVLLSGLAAVSAAGAFVYGIRTWPGTVRAQSLWFLFATTAGVTLIALAPNLAVLAIGFVLAGLFQSIVMVTRNLSLRERLPDYVHAAGYSLQYAVQGVGYSLSAALAAFMLARSTPVAAILAGVILTLILSAVSAVAELRRRPAPAAADSQVAVR